MYLRTRWINCSKFSIARHLIQSFDIGEVTPELAHEIGKQFADEILDGKYEYVLTTHIDKDHVHNHLIFNAVDFVDYHAYKSYTRIYYDMREISDRLCKENGLSVIPPSQHKGIHRIFLGSLIMAETSTASTRTMLLSQKHLMRSAVSIITNHLHSHMDLAVD